MTSQRIHTPSVANDAGCGICFRVKKRILIVDDDTGFVELVQYRLEHCDYDFATVQNGFETLRLCRGFRPHLVLMDVLLPDLDGLTLCTIIRNEPATKDAPVILLSGVDTDITRHSARAAGAHAFFGKPVDFVALEECMELALKNPALARPDSLLEMQSTQIR